MTKISTTPPVLQSEAETTVDLLDNWFDAIEVGLRERVREFIQAMIESELETALGAPALRPPPNGGYPEWRWIKRYLWPPARPPLAITDGDLWPGRDRGAARQARERGGQDNRMEEFGAARLPAANPTSRFADCQHLSCRDQYAACAAGPIGRFWRRGQQRYGEPLVAEGERRLGCLECPLVRRGADHPPDPGWHRGAGPARPQGHRDRAPGRARRARGRPESAVGRQEYGRRNQRGVARCSRRSRQARATQARVPDRRRRHWAGASTGCPLGRRADPTLHGPQAPQPARSRTAAPA